MNKAQGIADRATDPALKAAWQEVADQWRAMARQKRMLESETKREPKSFA